MKKVLMVTALVAFVGAMVAVAEEAAAPAAPAKDAPKAGCFMCNGCKKLADKAGKCCGDKDMACVHVLSVKDGVATGCACASDCAKCGEVKDGKCACGKDVATCSVVGKFVCEKCCVIADKAGKCATCGADLVEVKAPAKEAAAAAPAVEPAPAK